MDNERPYSSNRGSSRSNSSGGGSRSNSPGGGTGPGAKPHRFVRRKSCKFCMDKMDLIDFKDIIRLRRFITERGKIIPRRITGNCARHQRLMTEAVKRARSIALLPFSAE